MSKERANASATDIDDSFHHADTATAAHAEKTNPEQAEKDEIAR